MICYLSNMFFAQIFAISLSAVWRKDRRGCFYPPLFGLLVEVPELLPDEELPLLLLLDEGE